MLQLHLIVLRSNATNIYYEITISRDVNLIIESLEWRYFVFVLHISLMQTFIWHSLTKSIWLHNVQSKMANRWIKVSLRMLRWITDDTINNDDCWWIKMWHLWHTIILPHIQCIWLRISMRTLIEYTKQSCLDFVRWWWMNIIKVCWNC